MMAMNTKQKVGFISDIHIDYNQKKTNSLLEDSIVDIVEQLDLDYLIISGDIGTGFEYTSQTIKDLNKRTKTRFLYVPGNHDIWEANAGRNSFEILEFFKREAYCLLGKSLEIGNTIFVGGFPWYDYSLDTMGNSKEQIKMNSKQWVDTMYTHFLDESWPKVSKTMMNELRQILDSINKEKNIVVVQHFVPSKDFLKSSDPSGRINSYAWQQSNAFMGTEEISELTKKYSNIKQITFGHTHIPFGSITINGVEYLNASVGYKHEWKNDSFEVELSEKIIIKEY